MPMKTIESEKPSKSAFFELMFDAGKPRQENSRNELKSNSEDEPGETPGYLLAWRHLNQLQDA